MVKAKLVEAHIQLPGNIRWAELQDKDSSTITSATLFDIAHKDPQIPFITRSDYLDLSPFDRIRMPYQHVGIGLQNLLTRDAGLAAFVFRTRLTRLTGESSIRETNSQIVLNIIKAGAEGGKSRFSYMDMVLL